MARDFEALAKKLYEELDRQVTEDGRAAYVGEYGFWDPSCTTLDGIFDLEKLARVLFADEEVSDG